MKTITLKKLLNRLPCSVIENPGVVTISIQRIEKISDNLIINSFNSKTELENRNFGNNGVGGRQTSKCRSADNYIHIFDKVKN